MKRSSPEPTTTAVRRTRSRRVQSYRNERAAKVIQRAWRTIFRFRTTGRLVRQFLNVKVNAEYVKSISFESLVVMLREKPVIAATKQCLQRIHLISTFLHGSPSRALTPDNVNVRVVLAGFMVAFRPTHVFEQVGHLENALMEATLPLLTQFECICRLIDAHGLCPAAIVKATKDFPVQLFEYLKRFKAWKIPDEQRLTHRLKHALVALYQAEHHLPPDEPEDSKLKVEFRTQIERLRNKLQQIAGADALRNFDEQRQAGQIPGGGSSGGAAEGVYSALPGRMTNEQLAHELLLDPLFQLDDSGGCSIENPVFHRIRESFHQAFWDSLADDLRLDVPCYVRVLRVLAEIRDGINDLAGPREQAAIAEAIDLDFIKQKAEAGLYTWDNCRALIESIIAIVRRVQAPKRDRETGDMWAERRSDLVSAAEEQRAKALCKALEFLLDRVNVMRIDAANSRLRLISPVIKDHGIDYERGKFQDKLNDGSLTLERTTAWIRDVVRAEVAAKSVDMPLLLEGRASAFVHVHSTAVLRLVAEGNEGIKHDTCPETLLMDVHRLNHLKHMMSYLSGCVALLITLAHSFTATKREEALVELDTASKAVGALGTKDIKLAVATVTSAVRDTRLLSEASKATLARAFEQCVKPTDAVFQLITKRVTVAVAHTMKAGKIPEEVFKKLPATKYMKDDIDATATKLCSIANLNRTVHLPTYNTLIREAAAELNAERAA